MRARKLLHFS